MSNSGYITSPPGILKIVTVGIGVVTVGIGSYGIDQSRLHLYSDSTFGWSSTCIKNMDQCSDWAAIMFFVIIVLAWLGSIVGLILNILTDLKGLKSIDTLGHYIGGVCVIFAGLLAIYYGGDKISECKKYGDAVEGKCIKLYQAVAFILGGLLAIVNGVVYILAGMKISKSG